MKCDDPTTVWYDTILIHVYYFGVLTFFLKRIISHNYISVGKRIHTYTHTVKTRIEHKEENPISTYP